MGNTPSLPRLDSATGRMRELDALSWSYGVCFVSHGLSVGVRTTDPQVLERVSECLPAGSRPSRSCVVRFLYSVVGPGSLDPEDGLYSVYAGADLIARAETIEEAVDVLQSALDFGVALGSTNRVFVHAGVVGWRERALLVPGRSGSGKTSLVAALVRAGATYYSDEYAVLDDSGYVHPYARPLHVRSRRNGHRTRVSVDELGGRAGTRPLPVGLVVVTAYMPGQTWNPRALSPGEAVLALLQNSLTARIRTQAVLDALGQVVSHAAVLGGKRGEADGVVGALLEHLSREPSTRQRLENMESVGYS